jgi:hypothetical protein
MVISEMTLNGILQTKSAPDLPSHDGRNVVKAEVAGKSNWAEFASKLKTGLSRFLPISMAEPEGQKTEYTGPC